MCLLIGSNLHNSSHDLTKQGTRYLRPCSELACLIDANWVLKLANFGITNMLHKAIEREQLKLMEIIPLSSAYHYLH